VQASCLRHLHRDVHLLLSLVLEERRFRPMERIVSANEEAAEESRRGGRRPKSRSAKADSRPHDFGGDILVRRLQPP
jgi:hypothetical protein